MMHLVPTRNQWLTSMALFAKCAFKCVFVCGAMGALMPVQAAPLHAAWSAPYASGWLTAPILTKSAYRPSVQAAKKLAKERAPTSGKERSEKKPTGKVKFIRGNEESVAQRSARLTRECKGRVNAGMCEGYTR